MLVVEGVITKEVPTVVAVFSEDPPFGLKRDTLQERVLPYVPEPLRVLRMKDAIAGTFRLHLLKRQTGILERNSVYIDRPAIRVQNYDQLWYGINDAAKLALVGETE